MGFLHNIAESRTNGVSLLKGRSSWFLMFNFTIGVPESFTVDQEQQNQACSRFDTFNIELNMPFILEDFSIFGCSLFR